MFSAHFLSGCYNWCRRVGLAHYPAAVKEQFASGNAYRLSHRSLTRCAFSAALLCVVRVMRQTRFTAF
ncbi:hypothetical protein FDX05_21100 [Citrobacter sp. wls715]|uniref:Uncharacterized protein n=1 Tax=Citrobacter pasteurii TaxID=1563222 RepID=A0A6N6K082_9ENTR|nr:hypothetical protein DXF85_17645 [Citrobacter pasteurii]TKU53908.1 hypothetical protein FDX05_21100 [Citrobacter sp. wls715]